MMFRDHAVFDLFQAEKVTTKNQDFKQIDVSLQW